MPARPAALRGVIVVAFGAIGVGLVPWGVWLGANLRPDHTTHHWDVVWTGFDIALALAFGLTAVAVLRRSSWVASVAATTGTLLLVDAWFDVILESHGRDLRVALAEALLGELPMAVLCYWIAYRAERFLALALDIARSELSHLPAPGQRPAEGDLVGILEVAADREAAGEPGDANATA